MTEIELPQQYFERFADEKYTNGLCAPTVFHALARRQGYEMPPAADYTAALDYEHCWSDEQHAWLRPQLSRSLRARYNLQIVSWQHRFTETQQTDNQLEAMTDAGYIETPKERRALWALSHYSLREILRATPVISTVQPGFGANATDHAVLLKHYDTLGDAVLYFDPDARNSQEWCSFADLETYLSPDGACSVILPHKK